MSADAIARVIADLKAEGTIARAEFDWDGDEITPRNVDRLSQWITDSVMAKSRVRFLGMAAPEVKARHEPTSSEEATETLRADIDTFVRSLAVVADPVIIDASALYEELADRPRGIALYEDHTCVVPPASETAVTYVNQHGNVIVMHVTAMDSDLGGSFFRWTTDNIPDWSVVKWSLYVTFWIGGRGGGGSSFPTSGPLHIVQIALDDGGAPLDIRWTDLQIPGFTMAQWDMAQLVLLQALNFLNCRNVELVEPRRPRQLRRRMERESPGVTVKELSVFPVGKRYTPTGNKVGAGVPLHSVRGHFQHNGDCCPGSHPPRGLLFGKYSGRYWVPMHARGVADLGEIEKSYKLVP